MRHIDIEDSRALVSLVTVCDALLSAACLTGCYSYYSVFNPHAIEGVDLQAYLVVTILAFLPVPMFFSPLIFERTVSGDRVVGRTFQTAFAHILLVFSVLFLLKQVAIARVLLVTFVIVFWMALTVGHLLILYAVRWFRSRGRNQRNVVLVGCSEEMAELYSHMQNREYGFNVVGLFTEDEEGIDGVERLGTSADVLAYLHDNDSVNAVYCTMSRMSREDVISLYRYCESNLVRFYALPMYLGSLHTNMKVVSVGETVMLTSRQEPLRKFENRLLKRSLDLVVSTFFLLTLFPVVYTIVAIILKRLSPGPVIFVQKCCGLDGQSFSRYKFRSMHAGNGNDAQQVLPCDDREFPFGDFMRRTKIDKLPQFINVFLGSMSLVGPRPHILSQTCDNDNAVDRNMMLHRAKPGMTGWAQINGYCGKEPDSEMKEKRMRADIWYVENWTFWLDVRIIWRTLISTLLNANRNAN